MAAKCQWENASLSSVNDDGNDEGDVVEAARTTTLAGELCITGVHTNGHIRLNQLRYWVNGERERKRTATAECQIKSAVHQQQK